MRPLALQLEGFLSFREEQRLEFDEERVWLLSGPNGVGKSTVFDAFLFALYAGHRAGREDLHELIHKGSDRAVVSFEFELDGKRYRAERSVRRGVDKKSGKPRSIGAQQLSLWQADGWHAIEETHRATGFAEWVRAHIGLSFDAFTSSVLLMQGRADVLVSQDALAANRRFEVLSRLVDLEQYQSLHGQADAQRKELSRQLEVMQAQLGALPEISAAELASLAEQVEALQAELAEVSAEAGAVQAQKEQAAAWYALTVRRDKVQQAWNEAEALLGDSEAIRREGERWQELQHVVPALLQVLEQDRHRAAAEGLIAELGTSLPKLARRTEKIEAEVAQIRDTLAQLESKQQVQELARQKLAGEHQRITLAQGPLKRIARAREQSLQARQQIARLTQACEAWALQLGQQEQLLAGIHQRHQAVGHALEQANLERTRAETRLQAAQTQWQRFDQVADEKVCGLCGQPLDPKHARRERARLQGELAACQAGLQQAAEAFVRWQAEYAQSSAQQQQAEAMAAQSRLSLEEHQRQFVRVNDQLRTVLEALREATAELGAVDQERVADGYPSSTDLEALQRQATHVSGQLSSLQMEAAAHKNETRKLKSVLALREKDQDGLRKELADVDCQRQQAELRVELAQKQRAQLLASLDERWRGQADEALALQQEFDALTRRGAAARLQRLQEAVAAQQSLRREGQQLDAELAAFAPAVRRDPAGFNEPLQQLKLREQDLSRAQVRLNTERQLLLERQEQRSKLSADLLDLDRRRHLWARLAELLGPRQLQRHLLRQAERGIVAHTNLVLDRITSGQLTVRLLPELENDDKRALQLEAYKPALGQAFGLSFLSGSERFRVAISLALGIGQYASRRHHAIESVIIDEGFGCLDRDNRRTMIEELNHLRGQLRCILLISHQEEFADAFPEGYRFRMVNGSTQVSRDRD